MKVLDTRTNLSKFIFLMADKYKFKYNSMPLIEATQRYVKMDNNSIKEFDLVIFNSKNAIKFAPDKIYKHFKKNIIVATMGESTASILMSKGLQNIIYPKINHGSEGLANKIEKNIIHNCKKALIFRGFYSRDYLKEYLISQNINIHEEIVYVQTCPKIKIERVKEIMNNDIIIISSILALQTLHGLLHANKQENKNFKILLASERIAKVAKTLGLNNYLLQDYGVCNETILTIINKYFDGEKNARNNTKN